MQGFRRPPYYLTAYGLAVQMGFVGTLEEWLDSLSAYGIAVKMGFEGNMEQWLESLVGPTPEITVGEVTTLPAGSKATVSVTGTKENPVLNFGIPGGEQGEPSSALEGGTMTGELNMGGHTLTGLAPAAHDSDAVSKGYADEHYLSLTGGEMEGALDMGGYKLGGLRKPADDTDATTKAYVDGLVSGRTVAGAVSVTLTVAGWSDRSQTVSASGVTADESSCHVIVAPAVSSDAAYHGAGVKCSAQGAAKLTFVCDSKPSEALEVNVLVLKKEAVG